MEAAAGGPEGQEAKVAGTMGAALSLVSGVATDKVAMNAEAASSVKAACAGHDSVLEPKMDGWRTLWQIDGTPEERRARFWTRSGQELTGAWPAVEQALAQTLMPGWIIDGEAVVFEDANGVRLPKGSNAVTSILGSGTKKAALLSGALTLVVFDVLSVGGIDARPYPLRERRKALEALFAQADFDAERLSLSVQLDPTDENHDALLERGYEGSVVKWLDATYKSGKRGHGWFKMKGEWDLDAFVIGYEPGKEGFAGMVGAIVFGQMKDGEVVERGTCSGFDFATRKALTANPQAYVGKVFSLTHNGVWDPSDEHPEGGLRHARFKRWRPDRDPASVEVHDG